MEEKTMMVTPLSSFAEVHSFMELGDQFYVRKFPNNGNFETRFYGSSKKGIIFEVVPDRADASSHSGSIARV